MANLPRRKRQQDPKGRRRPTRCSHSDYPLGQTQGGPATRPHLGLAGGPSPAGCGELCLDELRFRVSDRTLAAQISTKVCTLAPAAPRPPAPPPLARSEHFLKCPLCTLGKGLLREACLASASRAGIPLRTLGCLVTLHLRTVTTP